MSLLKNPAAPTRRTLARAARPVLEALESRQLLTGTISVTNPYALPGNTQVMFNTMGTLNTYSPANVVHSSQALTIKNTNATQPLTLSSITVSGPFSLPDAAANNNFAGTVIAAGGTFSFTIDFTQATVPAHTVNETNYTDHTASGAAIGGSLTISSSDTATPTKVIALEGYFQQISNNNEEPSLSTIVNTLAGYQTNLGLAAGTPDFPASGAASGSEVLASDWEAANPAAPVAVQQLSAFRTQGNTATLSWYTAATQATHRLFVGTAAQGQTVLPTSSDGSTSTLRSNFTTTAAFGFRVDNEYSDDAINNAAGNTGGGGHHFRFFPLVDQSGNAVPNTYIMAMDYGQAQAENFDFQDNVYVVSNIRPATTPDTPTNLAVTTGPTPTLTWTASNYSPVGYLVSSSSTLNGTYAQLTPSPISATTFTDTTATTAATVFYRVVAVDTGTLIQSPAATVTANAGPVAASFSFGATPGVAQVFNAAANATDSTGTIEANTVQISAGPNHGGTATNNGDGTITYTPAAGYTGAETISYTVADSTGARSAAGTATFNVVAAGTPTTTPTTTPTATPTFNNQVAFTLVNAATTIDLLSTQTSNLSFGTSPITIVSQPTGGTLTPPTSGGVYTYTPSHDVVGGDSFTYKVTSAAGVVSAAITVNINVGVAVGSTATYTGVTFTDEDKTQVTVGLNRGVANVYFDGTGLYTPPAKGKTLTVSGGSSNGLHIRMISMSGTTAASALSIKGAANGPVTFGGVFDSAPLGSLTAKTANLVTNGGASIPVLGNALPAGYVELHGVRSISLGTATNATLSLQAGAGVASTAVAFAGAVSGTVLTSAIPISRLTAASWTAVSGNTPGPITAPSVNAVAVKGEFDADLTVSGSLGSAVVGPVNNGTWTVGGAAKTVTIATAGTNFGGISVTGALTNMTVKAGGLSADVTAASIGNLKVAGTLSGNVLTTGNLNALTVGGLSNATVNVGNTTTLAAATTATIGGATLKTLTVTGGGTAAVFNDSQVIAHTITTATTGRVNVTGTAGSEGLAAVSFKSAVVNANGTPIKLNAAALASDATLAAYLTSKNYTFGNFAIDVVTAAAT